MSNLANRATIVVGLDGSPASTDAARWAASLAHRSRSKLLLAHALPQDGPLYSPAAVMIQAQFLSQLREDGEAIVESAVEMLRQEFPGLEIGESIATGPAATHLLELARSARMVVLGSSGAGSLRSSFIGSTALHVANHASCPVTVWRGGDSGLLPDRRPVVVGVDGSKLSTTAVSHAFDFASSFDAPVIAVHTWQGSSAPVDWDAVEQEEAALTSESLAGVRSAYPDVPITEVTVQGAAAQVILEQAESAQLIVVGSHGRSAIMGALMGSTSQNLLHRAPCPTMICRSIETL